MARQMEEHVFLGFNQSMAIYIYFGSTTRRAHYPEVTVYQRTRIFGTLYMRALYTVWETVGLLLPNFARWSMYIRKFLQGRPYHLLRPNIFLTGMLTMPICLRSSYLNKVDRTPVLFQANNSLKAWGFAESCVKSHHFITILSLLTLQGSVCTHVRWNR